MHNWYEDGRRSWGYLNNKTGWIELTKGVETIVDVEDLPQLLNHVWHANKTGNDGKYRARTTIVDGDDRYTELMHRFIMEPGDGEIVDHINRNPLDNRKENLRLVDHSTNRRNTDTINSETGYRGVFRNGKSFTARIHENGKQICLGTYETPERAAKAYDDYVVENYDEHAATNERIGVL